MVNALDVLFFMYISDCFFCLLFFHACIIMKSGLGPSCCFAFGMFVPCTIFGWVSCAIFYLFRPPGPNQAVFSESD